jgi:hypothetical protein
MKKAVILVSGGLDSATVLAIAQAAGYACYAVSFDYGQRHSAELAAARLVSARAGVIEHRIVAIDLSQFGGSALTDEAIDVPEANASQDDIPITYVPAAIRFFCPLRWRGVKCWGPAIYLSVSTRWIIQAIPTVVLNSLSPLSGWLILRPGREWKSKS